MMTAPVSLQSALQRGNYYEIADHFVAGHTTTGLLGELGWNTTDSASGGAITKQNAAGHPGIYQLDSGATAGNIRAMYLSNLGNIDTSEVLETGYIFNLPAVTAASQLLRIGPMNSSVANPVYGYYLEKVAAEANWRTIVNFNSTANNPDMGIAVAAGWHSLLIRKYSQLLVGIYLSSALTHDWPVGTVVTNSTNGNSATIVGAASIGVSTLYADAASVASGWHVADSVTVGGGGNAENKTLTTPQAASQMPMILFRLDGTDVAMVDPITASVGLIPCLQVGNGSAAASRLLQVDYFRLRLLNAPYV
jgi:hypothetical protein